MVGLASYVLRTVADFSCSSYSQTCRNTSELLSHVFAVVVIFILIVGATKAQQLKELHHGVERSAPVWEPTSHPHHHGGDLMGTLGP